MYKPFYFLANILAVIVLFTGCSRKSSMDMVQGELSGVTVWVAYWDIDNAAGRIDIMKEGILGISCFAAYFDENAELFIPGNILTFVKNIKSEYKGKQWNYYLTFVNDQQLLQGSSLKDTKLLEDLFADDMSIVAHIDRIIALTTENGFDGIEIDYEAIRSNMGLWERFIIFCEMLYQRTENEGLELRIVLEPNAPLESLVFPEGPEYVMMCYNLYGFDSKAGPKANDKFLADMLEKMSNLPGRKSFALASGGFDWQAGKSGNPVTEAEAVNMAKDKKASVYRSEDSKALTFQYDDNDGKEHTVWYADTETLRHWQSVILSDSDYGIMLWRIE